MATITNSICTNNKEIDIQSSGGAIKLGTASVATVITVGNGTGASGIVLTTGSAGTVFTGFAEGALVTSSAGKVSTITGTAGYVLTANTAGSAPSFQAAAASGIVTINGNSGSITGTTVTISGSGVISTSGSSTTLTVTSTAANAINATSGTATASSNAFTIVGAGTVSTSATGSTLTITGSGGGGGITWNDQTTTSVTMAVNNAYSANNAGLVTLTLPSTAVFGSVVQVSGNGAGGWKIAQNAGQTIHFGSSNTTAGTGGSLASTNRYDQVTLVCSVANTDWVVNSSFGNITFV